MDFRNDCRIAYSRRSSDVRIHFGVIVVPLIVLTILIGWLSTTWLAFEKSLALTF
jgi:hypothetical protein